MATQSLSDFGDSVQHIDEMGMTMRAWCLLGFARSLEASDRPAEASVIYRRVLALPDHSGSHAKAQEALDRGAAHHAVAKARKQP